MQPTLAPCYCEHCRKVRLSPARIEMSVAMPNTVSAQIVQSGTGEDRTSTLSFGVSEQQAEEASAALFYLVDQLRSLLEGKPEG